LIKGIKKFRAYIERKKFGVITDHSSLQWLMQQKDLSGRLARWSIKFQGFSFSITRYKATQTVVANTSSRVNESEVNEFDNLGPIID